MTPPNSLRNPNVDPKVKQWKKNWGTFFSSKYFEGRKVFWSSRMKLKQANKHEFKMKSTYTTKERRWLM
jgi:hypothetical protein